MDLSTDPETSTDQQGVIGSHPFWFIAIVAVVVFVPPWHGRDWLFALLAGAFFAESWYRVPFPYRRKADLGQRWARTTMVFFGFASAFYVGGVAAWGFRVRSQAGISILLVALVASVVVVGLRQSKIPRVQSSGWISYLAGMAVWTTSKALNLPLVSMAPVAAALFAVSAILFLVSLMKPEPRRDRGENSELDGLKREDATGKMQIAPPES
jgi:hypothetical protein